MVFGCSVSGAISRVLRCDIGYVDPDTIRAALPDSALPHGHLTNAEFELIKQTAGSNLRWFFYIADAVSASTEPEEREAKITSRIEKMLTQYSKRADLSQLPNEGKALIQQMLDAASKDNAKNPLGRITVPSAEFDIALLQRMEANSLIRIIVSNAKVKTVELHNTPLKAQLLLSNQ